MTFCNEKVKGKKLHMLTDCKTRWNSLLAMLKRFEEVKTVLPAVLDDLGSGDKFPLESELETISSVVKALDTIEAAALALSRNDCDLGKADTIFDFIFNKLSTSDDPISTQFLERLIFRINERRDPLMSGLFSLLEDPENDGKKETCLIYLSNNELVKFCNELFLRLFRTEDGKETNVDTVDLSEPPEKVLKSASDELNALLTTSTPKAKKNSNSLDMIRKEIAVLKSTGKRPDLLSKVFSALRSVPVSSIEAERAFSAAGLFVTKMRTSLDDPTIDALCFLRAHLK